MQYLEGSSILCFFNKIIVLVSSLGPMTSLTTGSQADLQYQTWVPFFVICLNFNQKAFGYPHTFMPLLHKQAYLPGEQLLQCAECTIKTVVDFSLPTSLESTSWCYESQLVGKKPSGEYWLVSPCPVIKMSSVIGCYNIKFWQIYNQNICFNFL